MNEQTAVYTCTVWEDYEDPEVLGVFTTRELAQEQGRVWIEAITHHTAECYDHIFGSCAEESFYYRAGENKSSYEVVIERFFLDAIMH